MASRLGASVRVQLFRSFLSITLGDFSDVASSLEAAIFATSLRRSSKFDSASAVRRIWRQSMNCHADSTREQRPRCNAFKKHFSVKTCIKSARKDERRESNIFLRMKPHIKVKEWGSSLNRRGETLVLKSRTFNARTGRHQAYLSAQANILQRQLHQRHTACSSSLHLLRPARLALFSSTTLDARSSHVLRHLRPFGHRCR